MDKYAVVGNPISHSLSPQIHQTFAAQTQQEMTYEAIQLDTEHFEEQVRDLQTRGFHGINVTVPFKQMAWEMADKLSPRSKDAGATNTLIFQADGMIAGDNTDGIGLSRDLIVNHQVLIEHRKILILGAGGAVRGVLGPLLAKKPELLTIANRSVDKAEQLVNDFSHIGEIRACAYEDLGNDKFDLIINGTSAGLDRQVPPIPDEILGINSICYDMMYSHSESTAFVAWATERGALRAFDGVGMLVEQAAESFFIWRGVRPETDEIIHQFRHQNVSS